jgi:hypothetical protein
MVTVTFRFHDELNDFLAPARRRQEFSVPCAQAVATKTELKLRRLLSFLSSSLKQIA